MGDFSNSKSWNLFSDKCRFWRYNELGRIPWEFDNLGESIRFKAPKLNGPRTWVKVDGSKGHKADGPKHEIERSTKMKLGKRDDACMVKRR